MQRFFFQIEYGETARDNIGQEYNSLDEAQAEAVILLGEILRDKGADFWSQPTVRVTVTNESGLTLWMVEVHGTVAPVMRSQTT